MCHLEASNQTLLAALGYNPSRKREVSVRGALGATRGRFLRQFVTEGLILALSASAVGILVADGAMNLLTRLVPKDILAGMPYLQSIGLTPHVLLFALAISLCSAALFAFTPAISLSAEAMRDGLSEGGRSSSGLHWRRVGSNLVVVELATAVVLLVAAGLFGKSFYRLLQVDPGLQPHNLALLSLSAPRQQYSSDAQQILLERQNSGPRLRSTRRDLRGHHRQTPHRRWRWHHRVCYPGSRASRRAQRSSPSSRQHRLLQDSRSAPPRRPLLH